MDQEVKKKGPQCIGRGRKGLSTKIHVGLSPGFVHGVCLSEGQRVDMKVFSKLWSVGIGGVSSMLLRIKVMTFMRSVNA